MRRVSGSRFVSASCATSAAIIAAAGLAGCVIYTSPNEQAGNGLTRDRVVGTPVTPREPVYQARPAPQPQPAVAWVPSERPGPRPAAEARPEKPAPKSVAGTGTREASAAARPAPQVIEVKSGDTLDTLSQRHGVSISAILTANKLNTAVVRPGQKLVIPRDEASAHTPL